MNPNPFKLVKLVPVRLFNKNSEFWEIWIAPEYHNSLFFKTLIRSGLLNKNDTEDSGSIAEAIKPHDSIQDAIAYFEEKVNSKLSKGFDFKENVTKALPQSSETTKITGSLGKRNSNQDIKHFNKNDKRATKKIHKNQEARALDNDPESDVYPNIIGGDKDEGGLLSDNEDLGRRKNDGLKQIKNKGSLSKNKSREDSYKLVRQPSEERKIVRKKNSEGSVSSFQNNLIITKKSQALKFKKIEESLSRPEESMCSISDKSSEKSTKKSRNVAKANNLMEREKKIEPSIILVEDDLSGLPSSYSELSDQEEPQTKLSEDELKEKSEKVNYKDLATPSPWKRTDFQDCYVAEKFSGYQCFWDGSQLFSKEGTVYTPPKFFLKNIPNIPLDGILHSTMGNLISLEETLDKWGYTQLIVYDTPNRGKLPFIERLDKLKKMFMSNPSKYVKLVDYKICKSKEHLLKMLEEVDRRKGEGLILKSPTSYYLAKRRSKGYYEAKYQLEKEAVIVEYRGEEESESGTLVKAFIVNNMHNNEKFKISRGIPKDMKRNPPKIGTVIVYSDQGEESTGKPISPVFIDIKNISPYKVDRHM